MQKDEYCRRLHEVKWTAGVSARYHQKLEYIFGWLDKGVRISVAVVALAAVILAVPPLELHWPSFWVAVLAAVLAVALNVIPVVEKEKFHGEMFRAWSELRKAAVLEEHKTCECDAADHHVERLAELFGEMESLNAEDPFPYGWLQKKCEEAENLSEYGTKDGKVSTSSSASAVLVED